MQQYANRAGASTTARRRLVFGAAADLGGPQRRRSPDSAKTGSSIGITGQGAGESGCALPCCCRKPFDGVDARAARSANQRNGTPNSWASASGSTTPPRDSIRSAIFSSTMVGSPEGRIGPASMSWRLRLSASSTEDGVGTWGTWHLALQHIDRNARILGVTTEAVNAGQIDQGEDRGAVFR